MPVSPNNTTYQSRSPHHQKSDQSFPDQNQQPTTPKIYSTSPKAINKHSRNSWWWPRSGKLWDSNEEEMKVWSVGSVVEWREGKIVDEDAKNLQRIWSALPNQLPASEPVASDHVYGTECDASDWQLLSFAVSSESGHDWSATPSYYLYIYIYDLRQTANRTRTRRPLRMGRYPPPLPRKKVPILLHP